MGTRTETPIRYLPIIFGLVDLMNLPKSKNHRPKNVVKAAGINAPKNNPSSKSPDDFKLEDNNEIKKTVAPYSTKTSKPSNTPVVAFLKKPYGLTCLLFDDF